MAEFTTETNRPGKKGRSREPPEEIKEIENLIQAVEYEELFKKEGSSSTGESEGEDEELTFIYAYSAAFLDTA